MSSSAGDSPIKQPQATVRGTTNNFVWLTASSAGQVVIQFLIQVVLAYQFGARAEADALAAALVVPVLLAAIISGSLSYVLVPDLVACFSDSQKRETGWRLAGIFGAATGTLALLASLLVMGSSVSIVHWLYGDLPDKEQQTAARLLSILAWQILMSTLVSWSLAVHHSRHSFIVPAMGGVWGTLVTLLLSVAYGRFGIHWIAIAINVGSLISLIIHVLPIIGHVRLGPVPRSHWSRLVWALLPLVLGSVYLRIDPVVDRSLASQLSEGSVAHLHYAQRMIVALLAISTSGLSVIAFPQLAGRLASEGQAGFVTHFALAMRRLVLIIVPIAIGFGCFATAVITDLLQRGRFTSADSQAVGSLIILFMGMFIGASWSELLARGFYTLGDTRTPTVVGLVTVTLGLLAKWFSLPYCGVWGIAGSTSLAFLLNGVMMSWLLASKTDRLILQGSLMTLLVALASAGIACAVCLVPYTWSLGRTWTAAPLGAATYVGMLWWLGNPDVRSLLSRPTRS
ncbi:MAG: polysaccharide biosynthesis C-terminal domain-containing protein [Pirellulaceae bacterium]|nr:polysaccharide biosynthesis C-terminal domain-containing protein [Pirellulaceae bacterium]